MNKTFDAQGKPANGELFIFVHGYNVSFDDAAKRTAQMAYDLDFCGPPVFYSWPSRADILKYIVDENNVEWATPHLARFIRELSSNTSGHTIHLIAHSMGNRCLTKALRQLANEPGSIPPNIREVVLAAPDIDAGTFREFIPDLLRKVKRITLYASSKDRALIFSKLVHGSTRAGESGEDLVVVPPMDTIDASMVETDLSGHSYFGNSEVLADLYYLLREGKPPANRFGLEKKKKKEDLVYWFLSRRF